MKAPTQAEVAEIRARGGDPYTIAEAERRLAHRVAAQELCRVIEDAFAGVTLGQGVGLQQAQGIDDYADAATCGRYRAADEKEDWRRIPAEALNRCNSSPSFFDAEGMRFHLPSFLIAELHGEYHFDFVLSLTHLTDHRIAMFALLSAAQHAAVRRYLLHIAEDRDHQFYGEDIRRALEEYWTEAECGDPPPSV
ncbi:MAG: DUF6714 family protein [Prosthecobacter sp.]